ncbi:MAG TPA: MMPL family transporter [Actinomycetes bacterium]
MGPVSRWSVRHPWRAIGAWALLVALVIVLAGQFGGSYNDSFSLPDTESATAQQILEREFGASSTSASVQIVFAPASGRADAPAVKAEVDRLLAQLADIPSVAAVASPFDPQAAAHGGGRLSQDGTVGVAQVTFKTATDKTPAADVQALVADVTAANSTSLQVGAGGQVLDFAGTKPPSTELIGVLVAVVILLLMFGSLVAAGLPILSALIALGTGLSLVTVAARFLDIATFGPTLAAMIGLGVGIDYSLFVINRYRQAVDVGREPTDAAYEAVATAGRAVLFAGTTVIIALSGLFVLRINFMNGLAVGAAVTVLMVMLGAVTLLPAVLSLLGRRVFAVRMPWARRRAPHPEGGGFARYGLRLQRRPWVFLAVAVVFMVALAVPVLSIRQGFPDAGGKPAGNVQRTAYDLTSKGFGAGANGPFVVVAELPAKNDLAGAKALSEALGKEPGVAFASPPQPSKSGTAAIISVQPTTGPQDAATSATLTRMRGEVIPQATAGTGVRAYVGGTTAITEDFGRVLTDALPLFLTVVVGLGFLALVGLFRSIVVPLTAAVTSLLSLGAALGATVAVFQWGWFDSLFGITATGPILPFLPVMLFAILFGLSMDYQVFLVSRMQEEWGRTADNAKAVRRGLAGSGRVVAAAAAIMSSVFLSFVFGDDNTIKMFGLALAVAVLLDAFVVRLVLVPSLMTVLGRANWWVPGWLARILPKVHLESEEEAAEIADVDEEAESDPLGEPAQV